jgi:hypothetical protein
LPFLLVSSQGTRFERGLRVRGNIWELLCQLGRRRRKKLSEVLLSQKRNFSLPGMLTVASALS